MSGALQPEAKTLFDKVWDGHVVAELDGGYQLLAVDRHLVHDLGGPMSLRAIETRGLAVRCPELTTATIDHCVSSAPGRTEETTPSGARLIPVLRQRCRAEGVELFDIDDPNQGIVHVTGPEIGLTLPGTTLVCGDSHTCTHGALGALAWGIGSSEVNQVMATQCIIERKPQRMRISIAGSPPAPVEAKDVPRQLRATQGADLGVGSAIDYAGPYVEDLGLEGRMTLCNLSIELGAKIGMVAPDDKTFAYLIGRERAPSGREWEAALRHWHTLVTDPDAQFDRELVVDVGSIGPQVTWGTSPAQGGGLDDPVPDPADATDLTTAHGWQAAIDYMGLRVGRSLRSLPIDRAFIGSCTNARLSDLQSAADVIAGAGANVAPGVEAWVVPGSSRVKAAAEDLGLDKVFTGAGFHWREPSCSMCVATNGEYVAPGQRCISTSNRNFVGRQGPGARTHLASPATVTASALAGVIESARG